MKKKIEKSILYRRRRVVPLCFQSRAGLIEMKCMNGGIAQGLFWTMVMMMVMVQGRIIRDEMYERWDCPRIILDEKFMNELYSRRGLFSLPDRGLYCDRCVGKNCTICRICFVFLFLRKTAPCQIFLKILPKLCLLPKMIIFSPLMSANCSIHCHIVATNNQN